MAMTRNGERAAEPWRGTPERGNANRLRRAMAEIAESELLGERLYARTKEHSATDLMVLSRRASATLRPSVFTRMDGSDTCIAEGVVRAPRKPDPVSGDDVLHEAERDVPRSRSK